MGRVRVPAVSLILACTFLKKEHLDINIQECTSNILDASSVLFSVRGIFNLASGCTTSRLSFRGSSDVRCAI